jgi:hypothetical protein
MDVIVAEAPRFADDNGKSNTDSHRQVAVLR